MGEHQQQVAKKHQRMEFDELADAPLEALGLASSDTAALKQAPGIRTVRELADHRLVRRAQAIVNLAGPNQSPTATKEAAVALMDGCDLQRGACRGRLQGWCWSGVSLPCASILAVRRSGRASVPDRADRMGRTTPPPPLDITTVFPELAPLARRAVRLHPRAGTPHEGDNSLGGPLLWPADAPWPTCGGLRLVDRRQPIAPEDLKRSRELDALERERWLTAEEAAQRRRIFAGAGVIDFVAGERIYTEPQPHQHPVALVPVLQLYARDVPELPFPEHTDLFQLLWCPNRHAAPWWGPRPHAVWRRAAEVTQPLAAPPAPRFDEEWFATDYVPLRCVLHSEPVVEYPDPCGLPTGLAERIQQWDTRHDGLYSAALSTAPGTKVGGHPSWIQGPQWPQCRCGRRMQHLLTVASGEFDALGRWLPLEDRSDPTSTAPQPYVGPDPWPPGIMLGDLGSLYLFTCTVCAERPLAGTMQF